MTPEEMERYDYMDCRPLYSKTTIATPTWLQEMLDAKATDRAAQQAADPDTSAAPPKPSD